MLRAQGIDAFRQGSRMSIGALDGPAACAVDALRARYKWIRFDHDGDSEPAGDYHYHCSDTGSDSHRQNKVSRLPLTKASGKTVAD